MFEVLPDRAPLLALGDYIQLLGLIPSLFLVIDYGFIRPRRMKNRLRRFQPWWATLVGIMFFSLAVGLTVTQIVVAASLTFGPDYPGREFVRIFGYLISTSAIYFMSIVYVVEGRQAASALGGRVEPEDTAEAAPKL